jgi:hypothetical protein
VFFFFIVSGCCGPRVYELTPFPPYSGFVESDEPAVLEYNKKDKTYIITQRGLNNAVVNQIYIDAIHEWKKENSVR